jgi:hypothetical protein
VTGISYPDDQFKIDSFEWRTFIVCDRCKGNVVEVERGDLLSVLASVAYDHWVAGCRLAVEFDTDEESAGAVLRALADRNMAAATAGLNGFDRDGDLDLGTRIALIEKRLSASLLPAVADSAGDTTAVGARTPDAAGVRSKSEGKAVRSAHAAETVPLVDRPDSVTHWSCPAVEGGLVSHHIEPFGPDKHRCRYCKCSKTFLENEQALILAAREAGRG